MATLPCYFLISIVILTSLGKISSLTLRVGAYKQLTIRLTSHPRTRSAHPTYLRHHLIYIKEAALG